MTSIVIRSGGQTGVDRAALDVAIFLALPYAGWCPKGGWADDHDDPPGVRPFYPQLTETPSADPRQRTAWNVRDANATFVVLPKDGVSKSAGTDFTLLCVELVFERPAFVLRLGDADAMRDAHRWLDLQMTNASPSGFVLNVAGPRESEAPGISDLAFSNLQELLRVYARTERPLDSVSRRG